MSDCRTFRLFGLDVVETKNDIDQIVSTLKIIRTVRLSRLFTAVVCCLKHVEILTNFVSTRHREKCSIFGFFAKFVNRRRQNEKRYQVNFLGLKVIRIVLSSGLFTTIVCCSQHVKIWTNFVSARHLVKCPIFGHFAKFGNRHRRNEIGYR